MSTATAVPLRPVAKSGVAILWGGIIMLLAGAVAWALFLSNGPSISMTTVRAGTGAFPVDDEIVIFKYEGRLAADGTVFDSGDTVPLPVSGGGSFPGFSQGLKRMQVGGKYILRIPAALAYGAEGQGPIPANSDLEFTVELQDIKSEAEMRAMMQQQQMMQQMMQGQGGGAPPQP